MPIPLNPTRRSVGVTLAAASLAASCAPKRRRPERLRVGYQKNGVLLSAKSRGLLDIRLPHLEEAYCVAALLFPELGLTRAAEAPVGQLARDFGQAAPATAAFQSAGSLGD